MKPDKKQLDSLIRHFKRLDLASVSFNECRTLANHVIDLGLNPKSGTATLYSACTTGVVTTYARPFLQADGLGPLAKEFKAGFSSDVLATTHTDLLAIRHSVFAHRDLIKAKNFKLHSSSYPGLYESIVVLKETANGKCSIHSEPALLYLDPKNLPSIVELCDFQISRVTKEAVALLKLMAGGKLYQPGKYILGKDFP